MQALILAGGKGTRLRPYTTVLPKPLMPIGDYPILEIILMQLKKAGIEEVILAVGHMSQLFEAFFKDGKRHGIKITYSFEEKALGTAGPLSLVIDKLEDDFLVMNGDLFTTLNYESLFSFHKEKKSSASISIYQREVNIDFGVIEFDKNSCLTGYVEKPSYKYDVSMGVNVFNKKAIMPYLKPDTHLDIPELMLKLKNDGHNIHCYKEQCYWLDIGRIDDYQKAIDIFEARKNEFIPSKGPGNK